MRVLKIHNCMINEALEMEKIHRIFVEIRNRQQRKLSKIKKEEAEIWDCKRDR